MCIKMNVFINLIASNQWTICGMFRPCRRDHRQSWANLAVELRWLWISPAPWTRQCTRQVCYAIDLNKLFNLDHPSFLLIKIWMLTVNVCHISGIAAVLFGQHRLWYVLVQRINGAVEVYALTDFLLQEGSHKVNDCINQWRHVDDVNFF